MKWIGASVAFGSICAISLWGAMPLVPEDSTEAIYWVMCGTTAVVLLTGTGFIARRTGPGWLGPTSIVVGALSVFATVYFVLAAGSMGPVGPSN